MLTPFWRVENEIWTTKKTGLLRQNTPHSLHEIFWQTWNILADILLLLSAYFRSHTLVAPSFHFCPFISSFANLTLLPIDSALSPSATLVLPFCRNPFLCCSDRGLHFAEPEWCHMERWQNERKREKSAREGGRERESRHGKWLTNIWFNLFGFIIFLCTRFLIWEMPLEGEWSR